MAGSRVIAGEMMEVNVLELHVGGGIDMVWKRSGYREMKLQGCFQSVGGTGIKQMTIIQRFIR